MTNCIDTIIFDLDGTLVNSSSEIIECLTSAFVATGLRAPVLTADHIGKKLPEIIHSIDPHLEADVVSKITIHFRSFYDSIVKPKTTLIYGVENTLKFLTQRKLKLFIATNKPKSATLPLLHFLKIHKYFQAVLTPTSFEGKDLNKKEMIEFIITNYNRKSNKTLMVGDHGDDILAAKANNIKSVAYLGGYSGVDSLVKSNPDYIIKEIYELCTLLKDGQADCKI